LLSPYRVLDLTNERGVFAGSMFGRLGADVIQVEPPGGSPARRVPPFAEDAPPPENSHYWSAYASGKRGITCALDRPEGRSLLRRLVSRADVLFESEGPSLRPELRFAALKDLNPRLVHVTITSFGSEGPKAGYADSELIAWAASGPLWPNRDHHGMPYRISARQAWLHAGADAASGAMLALFARERTGRGQHVDVSAQQSSAMSTLSYSLSGAIGHENFSLDSPTLVDEPDLLGQRKLYIKWRVKDGFVQMHLGVGPFEGRTSNQLFEWMRRENAVPPGVAEWDWIELPKLIESGAVSHSQVEQAREAVAACLARRTKREIMKLVVEEGLPMAPALTVAEVRDSEHYRARALFETVEENGRPRTLPGRLGLTSVPSHPPLRPAPRLGEHNEDVYGELLGLTPADVARLKQQGIV
jgi:crotonobetainyl-CoA:carnitine CoA-transferase CaiB-like acyl-CoA transferase